MEPTHLSAEPKVIEIERFISKDECTILIDSAKFKKSKTLNLDKNQARISESSAISDQRDLKKIITKLKSLISENFDYIEAELTRYDIGGEYKPHFDAYFREDKGPFLQRIYSIIIYLNEGFDGGKTYFPNLDLEVDCEIGKAVIFKNCMGETEFIHPNTLHGSKKIISGEKFILALWLIKKFN